MVVLAAVLDTGCTGNGTARLSITVQPASSLLDQPVQNTTYAQLPDSLDADTRGSPASPPAIGSNIIDVRTNML